MGVWEIIIGAIVLLLSVVMIIVIILQEGHDAGLGTITGGADSFAKRGKAKTADAMFAKITKFVAVGFFIFVVVLNAISYFGGKNSKTNEATTITGDTSVVSETSAETETSQTEETSKTEESSKAEESSKTEESSKAEESSKTEESSKAEESSKTEESSSVVSETAESSAAA